MIMFIIRKAEVSDFAEIAELSRDSLGYDCTDELVKERLAAIGDDYAVYVAQADGKAVGFIHGQVYVPLYYDKMVNILGLAVSPEYRRKGVARRLIAQIEQWAKDNGIGLVRLNSGSTRTGAHEFYRSQGFSDEKMQVRFIKHL